MQTYQVQETLNLSSAICVIITARTQIIPFTKSRYVAVYTLSLIHI